MLWIKNSFFYYLKKYYTVLYPNDDNEIYAGFGFNVIHIPLFTRPYPPYVSNSKKNCENIRYDIPKKHIYLTYQIKDRLPKDLQYDDIPKDISLKLRDNFLLKEEPYKEAETIINMYIYPKDGSEVTNSFFIKVVNFILDNLPEDKRGVKVS